MDPTLHVTVSIGVAPIAAGQSSDATLAHADLALYAAKGAGRNRARLFCDAHYQSAAHRVSLLQRVGAALEEGTMRLYAQPIVDLRTGGAARHELLIRLRDGLEPALSPADFLPAAERTDLVLELDRWVLEHAVRALADPRAQAAGLRLEVNVSARSLENPDLGRWILELLKEAEVAPERFGLEITETTAIKSLDAARLLATRLTEAGCGFALDDFGAGFGSFSYLKYLPFTTVKIAGEFVRQVDDHDVDRALVSAVVGVAHQLGMRTVAEQVDRPALVTHLRALGVDDGQGFHLGRPRPLDGSSWPEELVARRCSLRADSPAPSRRGSGIGSLIAPTNRPSGPRLWKASSTHSPSRSRTRRPTYRRSSETSRAAPTCANASNSAAALRACRHPDPAGRLHRAPAGAELGVQAGEQQQRPAVDDLQLRHLQLVEPGSRRGERRLRRPRQQVGRAGVPEHAAVARRAGARAGRGDQVPAVAVGVGEHPRVAPRLVPALARRVPAGVGAQHGVGRVPGPDVEVGGGREAGASARTRRRPR